MEMLIGRFLGAVVAMYVLSRVTLFAFRWLKDDRWQMVGGHALAVILATVMAGFGFVEEGEGPRFAYAFLLYGAADIAVVAIDLWTLAKPDQEEGSS